MGNARQREAAKRKRLEEEAKQQPPKTADAACAAVAAPETARDGSDSGHELSNTGEGKSGKRQRDTGLNGVEDNSGNGMHDRSKSVKGRKEFEVFIGGVASSATEGVMRKYFEECGKIDYCRVPVNDDGSARGIAFIKFTDQESVDKALEFHDAVCLGRTIQVRFTNADRGEGARSKGAQHCGIADYKDKGGCNHELEVFLHGIPPCTTQESLRADFAHCGEIVRLTLPMTSDGEAAAIAFIEFKNQTACAKALKLNNTRPGGCLLNVRMNAFNGFEARAKHPARGL